MGNKRLPTIAEYMKDHVDSKVDWCNGSFPCPFHNEKHGKSFSIKDDIWSCFGSCQKRGQDVIALHQHNTKMKTREEAEKSLFYLYHIDVTKTLTFETETVEPDEILARRQLALNRALRIANTPDKWVELDYIVSKVPYDVTELEMFCGKYGYS